MHESSFILGAGFHASILIQFMETIGWKVGYNLDSLTI